MSIVFSATSSSGIHPPTSILNNNIELPLNEFARQILLNGSYTFHTNITTTITGTDKLLTWRASMQSSIDCVQAIFEDAVVPFGYGIESLKSPTRSCFTLSSDNSSLTIKATSEFVVKPTRSREGMFTTISNLFKRMLSTDNLILRVAPSQNLTFLDVPESDLEQIKNTQKLAIYLSLHMPESAKNVVISSESNINIGAGKGSLFMSADSGFSLTLVMNN